MAQETCTLSSQSTESLEPISSINLDRKTFLLDQLDTDDDLLREIRQVSIEVLDLLKDYPQWCDKYLVILEAAPEVISWAKEYDYSGIRANGYWSLIKIALKLGKLVLEKYSGVENPQVDHNLELLLDYSLIALNVLRILRKDSVENGRSLITSTPQYFVDLFGLLLSIDDKMVAAMYGRYAGFWLCDNSRYSMIGLGTVLAIGARGLNKDVLQCLYDPDYRGLVMAKIVKSADVDYVKMMGSLMELRLYKQILPGILYWKEPIQIRDVYMPRQKRWIISAHNVKVMRFDNGASITHNTNNNSKSHPSSGSQIRCRLYQNTKQPLLDTLVLHMHGGGFIIGSPESHDVYIQQWVSSIPGCTILSVDYSVAPEAKFPVALQQLIDVYIQIVNNPEDCDQKLGFRPRSVVLAGDSAGGNMTMAALHVISDINEQLEQLPGGKPLPMPKAIYNLYSPYNLTLNITPSMILASCDSMISAGVMLSCFEAYLPIDDLGGAKPTETDNRFKKLHLKTEDTMNSNQDKPGILDPLDSGFWTDFLQKNNIYSQGIEMLQSMFQTVKSYIRPDCKPRPWYLADKPELEAKMELLKEVTFNPYISPLLYPNFDRLKDVNLYIIALHYDPFLDDCVTMAKKWTGPVQLDIIDGQPHGFLNLIAFVDEAKKANQLCVDRLREAIYS